LPRETTRFGERQFDGLLHTLSAAGRVTRDAGAPLLGAPQP
jgi:hypothetical protein